MKYLFLISISIFTLLSCKKEGCMDPTALNYDQKAKKSTDNCIYDNSPKVGSIILTQPDIDTIQVLKNVPGVEIDYKFESGLSINHDLVIDSGVVIEYSGILNIDNGTLTTNGTTDNRVVFKALSNYWYNIVFSNASCNLNFTDFIGTGIKFEVDPLLKRLNNVTIQNAARYGIEFFYNPSSMETQLNLDVTNVTIASCAYAILLTHANQTKHLANFNFQSNTNNFVAISYFTSIEDVHLHKIPVPYYISSQYDDSHRFEKNITVDPGVTIILDQGVEVVFYQSNINFLGTSAEKINIAGRQNLDKYWKRFTVSNSGQDINFEHVNFMNGGLSTNPILFLSGSGSGNVLNCYFDNVAPNCGITHLSTFTLNSSGTTFRSPSTGICL